MRLRQVGARDKLRRARIADVDGGEILWRTLVGEPKNAPPVLRDLDRHALADPAEPVELVMRELPKIPNRRVCHVRSLLVPSCDREDRNTRCNQPSSGNAAASNDAPRPLTACPDCPTIVF